MNLGVEDVEGDRGKVDRKLEGIYDYLSYTENICVIVKNKDILKSELVGKQFPWHFRRIQGVGVLV